MLRQTLPLLLVLAPIAVRAQTVQTPILIQSGSQIQIPVPPGADKPRLQVILPGSNTVLDDERANIQNGVATARLEADPGTYDVRLVTNDKARTPIGPPRRFQIPGFKREAGRWLFNGSAVAYEGTNPSTLASVLPVLRRDKKTKLPVSVAANAAVAWDIQSFGDEFQANIRLLPGSGGASSADLTGLRGDFQKEQAQRDASHPNGALLLSLIHEGEEVRPWQEAYIDVFAPLVDGIVVDCTTLHAASLPSPSLGPIPNSLLKIARRNVEESPNFDLPVFARFSEAPSDAQLLRAFQDGASNLIVPDGVSSSLLDVLTRQSARFSGAVTLEDVGLRVDDFDRFAPYLRRAARVPLLARLPGEGNGDKKGDDKNAESLFVAFNSSTDAALLDKIARAAKVGATIYCEGTLPPALISKWSDITKTQISVLPAPKKATVTFAEPWFWGTLNDQNFDVTQTVTINVKPSIAAQTKDVKGEARETVARPIARFNDDPNAIMLCPIDKGRIIWTPFDVSLGSRLISSIGGARTKIAFGLLYDNDLSPTDLLSLSNASLLTSYYAAIAGAMQPSLAEYTATKGDASNVSVALRAIPATPNDPKSSAISLIAFFNSSNEPVDLNAEVRGNGEYALDLMTNQKIPIKVRDFGTRIVLQVPANGFRWLALAKDEQSWNDAGKNGAKAQLR
ncbi:hypothetical protein IAD21_01527 [Abditibacteriota bacterium]|nr:hypothetical protein IAD21_01527 [Abditibacteriota bacterium]